MNAMRVQVGIPREGAPTSKHVVSVFASVPRHLYS